MYSSKIGEKINPKSFTAEILPENLAEIMIGNATIFSFLLILFTNYTDMVPFEDWRDI